MNAIPQPGAEAREPLSRYQSILLALDSSDHANRATVEAVAIATQLGARITASHVYAAKMHDVRFRQMEGGLPEQFREEQELERQRNVHDDLITRGLSIITDSYLDQAERACEQAALPFSRRALEGKNYRALVDEANSGGYDLLVMGALGLGAIEGSRVGTVCDRVVRRSNIDTLVIREPGRALAEGPVVVAVDGSARAYGGLLTALTLTRQWQVPVKVVAAFDPYYHYVAFNRIAGVLSEEAGKVFRFQEQEKLHEEIIDSGLAKIYQGHLEIAQSVAAEHGVEIETRLLTGKPHHAIEQYLAEVSPSLLVLGRLGIHADPELDIGGNAENLLHNAGCALLLSQRQFRPAVELLADVTTSWTREAETRMDRVPSFVRSMARMAILRFAQEQGHTVITERIVEDATAKLMPGHAEQAMEEIVAAHDAGKLRRPQTHAVIWSDSARALLETVAGASVRDNLRGRIEKKARVENQGWVDEAQVRPFLSRADKTRTNPDAPHWNAAALARLARVPEGFMRDASRTRIESYAKRLGHANITLEITEAGLAEARKAMEQTVTDTPTPSSKAPMSQDGQGKCPFSRLVGPGTSGQTENVEVRWDEGALALLERVPEGFCRSMTRKAAETIATGRGLEWIDQVFVEQVMKTFETGARDVSETMAWESRARERIARAPDMVRGMLVGEIELWARREELQQVTLDAVNAVKTEWRQRGVFHLDPADPRNQ